MGPEQLYQETSQLKIQWGVFIFLCYPLKCRGGKNYILKTSIHYYDRVLVSLVPTFHMQYLCNKKSMTQNMTKKDSFDTNLQLLRNQDDAAQGLPCFPENSILKFLS